jgi:hypothetical protein
MEKGRWREVVGKRGTEREIGRGGEANGGKEKDAGRETEIGSGR